MLNEGKIAFAYIAGEIVRAKVVKVESLQNGPTLYYLEGIRRPLVEKRVADSLIEIFMREMDIIKQKHQQQEQELIAAHKMFYDKYLAHESA